MALQKKKQSVKRDMCILTLLVAFASQSLIGQSRFSEQQLVEDLIFYRSKLEQYHPNLYIYTSKEKMNHFFDSLTRSIDKPLDEAEFYRKITLTSALVKDGHTLILPSNSFVGHHNSNSKFIPLQIGLYEDQLYVKMNCTPSIVIEDGTIIDSINGISAGEIIEELSNRQVRDGNNLSYSNWILDTYFREYYSYTFGHPEVYMISYKKDEVLQTLQMPALVKDSVYHYRQSNYPEIYSNNTPSKGVYLDYDSSRTIAILTIKDFHSEVLKSEYRQNFRKEIRSIFERIFLAQPRNLVIDLRNNQGGDVENGVLLLSYLINRPFKIVEEYNRVKKGRLVKCKGPSPGFHRPDKNQFMGQIYVMLNGGSFSNSAIVSSCLRENTNAIFVGTETGGNPNVLAGYAKEFELPNTRIKVEIPTKQFIMTSLMKNDGSGLIPTHEIDPDIQDNIHRNDRQLAFVMRLIKENENILKR